jgi:hypothetical protein
MATIRNTGKQTIYLNTSFRAGRTIQNPFWSLPSSLISNTNDDETLKLTVIDMLIPYQAYNIFQYPDVNFPDRIRTSNNTVQLGTIDWELQVLPAPNPFTPASSIAQTFTLPQGNYNVYEISNWLENEIQTFLRTTLGVPAAQNIDVVIVYNFNLMKYIITIDIPAIDGRIMGGSNQINFPSTDNWNNDIGLSEILAGEINDPANSRPLQRLTTTFPTQSISWQSFGQGNIGIPRSMVIQLDMISSNIGVDGNALGHTTTMATIPINIPNGDTLTYQNQNDDFDLEIPSHYIDTIQMEIKDEKGRPIFTNKDFQFSFRIDYVKLDHSTENLLQELIYLSQLSVMGQKELVESTEPDYKQTIQGN